MSTRSFGYFLVAAISIWLLSCNTPVKKSSTNSTQKSDSAYTIGQYGYDLQFLKKRLKLIELRNGVSRILLVPQYQGRVMTSSANGEMGFSFGWINHRLIESGKTQLHINAWGGEERLWFGPEGGQFSIFFAKEAPFDVAHWQTPACIDTDAFEVVSSDSVSAVFAKTIELSNYSGSVFNFLVERKISLLGKPEIAAKLNIDLPEGIQMVAYESKNSIKNTGANAWTQKSGTLSVWLLGMMNPSPGVTVVIPHKKGGRGPVVRDDYFGKVPSDRLIIKDQTVFFKADGKLRSKIGISYKHALPVIGSYDAANRILTILETTIDSMATDYVNSAWEIQKNPFSGDVINSYNDGPMADGSQMGPFYELESSSKAAFLKPDESLLHVQRTYHFIGDEKFLSQIALRKLGISIEQIKSVFNK